MAKCGVLEGIFIMNKKYITAIVAMVATAVVLVLLGVAVNLWDLGFNVGSLVGLIAVVPAVIWVLLKGVNYINSAIYFAGIGYIMFKNIFGELSGRFVVICILLAVLAVVFASTAMLFSKNKEAEADCEENEKGQELNG